MPDSTITLRTRADLSALIGARNSFAVLTSEEQKAERQALALSQSMATLDAKLGDAAGGARRLRESLRNAVYVDPKQGISALNQIISLEKKAADEAARLGKAGGLQILPRTLESFGTQAVDQFKSSILGLVGPAALVTTAIQAIPAAFDLAKVGANADLVEQRFNALAVAAGTTGEALLTSLQKASGGEIDDLNLQLVANKANLLGVADSAQEFGTLMAIARDRAQSLGISTTQAFNDLVTGLGRGSALILDNLGIVVDAKEVNEAYAASLGKSAEALTEAEKKQALINAVIAQGNATLAQTGGAIETNAGKFAKATASFENIKNLVGSGLANYLAPTLDSFNVFAQTSIDTANSVGTFLGQIRNIGVETPGAEAALAAFDAEMQKSGDTAQAEIAYQAALAAARTSAIPPVQQLTAAIIEGGGAYDAYAVAANASGIAAQEAAGRIQFSAEAMQLNAEASVLAAGKQDAQKAITAGLTAETNASVNAFLALNANLDAAGIASLVAAGKVPPLIGELAAMRLEAERLTGQLNLLAAQQAGVAGLSKLFAAGVDPGKGTTTGRGLGRLGGGAGTLSAQNDALQNSRDALALANAKTNAEKLAIYQRQLDRQTTEIGRNRVLAQIAGLKNTGGSSAASGKGLGALDRVDIALAGDYQSQLDAVNKKLAAGNLTELQRKQLIKEQVELQQKITDEQERANQAALDARISAIENRKKDREDAKRLSAAQAVLKNPNLFSEEQRLNATDLVELLPLEQEKRNRDVAAKAREAGIALPVGTSQPSPGAAQPPIGAAPQAPTPVGTGGTPLILQLDSKQVGVILLPTIIDGLRSGTFQVRAAGG